MEYFRLKQDPAYMHAPIISDVIKQIDPRRATPEHAHHIKARTMVEISNNAQHEFPDLLDRPLFLVSDALQATIKMYLPKLSFKTVVLVSPGSHLQQIYHLPIFLPVNCLSEQSAIKSNQGWDNKLVLKQAAMTRDPIFRVQHNHETIIILRLDAAESILRRNFRGVRLYRVDLVK